jgi:hypothetical protein
MQGEARLPDAAQCFKVQPSFPVMQPSPQQVQLADAPTQAKAKKEELPLLSLLTHSPTGNVLVDLSGPQRNLFFEYLLLFLHNQRKEQSERAAALLKRPAILPALPAAAISLGVRAQDERQRMSLQKGREAQAAGSKAEKEAKGNAVTGGRMARQIVLGQVLEKREGDGGAGSAAGASSLVLHGGEERGAGSAAAGPDFPSAFGQKARAVSMAMEWLAPVIDDYARGDEAKERRVVGELHSRMRKSGYQTDDVMAALLLVIEDDVWSGEEGGVGSARLHGGATRLSALVPQKLRTTALDSAEVRLASVREMLRYYFLAHPEEYHAALAAALGITADQEEDVVFLQERLAYLLASIGAFALAQKILAELKKKRKMDTKECLMRLGYRYDRKNRRLIVGKRTCGRPAEARGIMGLLLAAARK